MGGDYAPEAAVKGAVMALDAIGPDSRIVLFGDEARVRAVLAARRLSCRPVRYRCYHRGDRDGRPSRQGVPGQGRFEHHGGLRLPGQRGHRRFCQCRQHGRHDGRVDVRRETDRGGHPSHDLIHRSHGDGASRAAAGRGTERGLQTRGAGAVRADRLDLRRSRARDPKTPCSRAQHRRGGDQGQRPDQGHLRIAEGRRPHRFRGQRRGVRTSSRARSPT